MFQYCCPASQGDTSARGGIATHSSTNVQTCSVPTLIHGGGSDSASTERAARDFDTVKLPLSCAVGPAHLGRG